MNHGEEAVVPTALIRQKKIEVEVWGVQEILAKLQDDIEGARSSLVKAHLREEQYTYKGIWEEVYHVGEQALLSIVDMRLAGNRNRKPGGKHVGPFPMLDKIGAVAYRLQLPDHWSIHPVFHISKLLNF